MASANPDPIDIDMSPSSSGGLSNEQRRLTNEEVKAILQLEIEDALGGFGSQVAEERRLALRYYYGRPIGNEVKDRSQVVMRDVLEVVEWTMPSLMRMFTGGAQVVRYHPTRAGDEAQHQADLATAYINHLFRNKLGGFQILYDWMKTGLLEKNGIVKVYFDERKEPRTDSYTGLTEDEVLSILADNDVEPLAHETYSTRMGDQEVKLANLTVRRWQVQKGICIDSVPPEEFLIARREIRLDDQTRFSGHRKKMMVSDLVAMGYPFDVIAQIPSDDTPEYTMGRTERLSEDETYPLANAERVDAASREVWTTDCYARMDEDGDGYSELRNILIIGEHSVTILDDVEVNYNPFCSITPVPMPHKFFGNSLADLVMDLQVIRTTIARQLLDHMYLANAPRLAIVEGMVEHEDLLRNAAGALVRQRAPGQIEPIDLPKLPSESMEMFKELESVRSARTGVMVHGSELDATAINSTATGISVMQAEKQQKIELIARIYAETGIRQLFQKILRCLVENDTKQEQFEFQGEWVTVDPRTWDPTMHCEVEVGLGAGAALERMNNLSRLGEMQVAAANMTGMGYIVGPKELYETGSRFAEAAGFRNPELFFANPARRQPPEPEPKPEVEKLKLEALKAETEAKQKAAQLEFDAQKERDLVMHRAADLESKERVEMERIRMEERVRLGQQEATLEAARITARARPAPGGGDEG